MIRVLLAVAVFVAVASGFLFVACENVDVAVAPIASALGPAPVLNLGGGNALTLPAQRHLVRIGTTLLLALQQDGADGHKLGMFRSDDDGRSWRRLGDLAQDPSDRDTADLVVVGQDVALVSSFEGPTLAGSTAHDVWFQWWRHRASGEWTPDPAVKIFDSTSGATGYYRAELTVDSRGRLWAQAFLLQANGTSTSPLAVSSDGGTSFTVQPSLVTLPFRGGGRLAALGSKLIFVYDGHDAAQPAHFRLRADSDPLATWGPETQAFAEGIYHGAALSAVGDGAGGLHLVYKDKNQSLWYRRFDGAAFGRAQLLENVSEWELQAALTRLGGDLVVFYNRVYTSGSYDEVRARTLRAGVWSAPALLDSSRSFKGYPAAVELLPTSVSTVPCLFGVTPDANQAGRATLYGIDWTATPPPPADLATGGGPLFSDAFNRNIPPDNGLGAGWSVAAGWWFTDGRAVSDSDSGDRATAAVSCADCRVQARVVGFGVAETGIFVRGSGADRYELVLLGSGRLRIRRLRSGAATTLGEAASGIASLGEPATIALDARGATLQASVDGVTKLSVTDATPLTAAGAAGLVTSSAGVAFDDFAVSR
ncbi:MAG: uncharacterized protein JWN44_4028 [Myxococcales bacterium]|nr:uncharacterized protein [Myxococcales bacterium]